MPLSGLDLSEDVPEQKSVVSSPFDGPMSDYGYEAEEEAELMGTNALHMDPGYQVIQEEIMRKTRYR